MIENNMDLIRDIAWSYHRTNPSFEFDDLFGEGCVAYLMAEQEFDPAKGVKKSTYIWMYVQSCLNNFTQGEARQLDNGANQWANPVVFEDIAAYLMETNYSYQPERNLMAKETYAALINSLSPMAQELVGYILGGLGGYLPLDTPKMCRGAIKDALREKGWSWGNIWDTFKELKVALA